MTTRFLRFVDRVRFVASGGKGGNGCVSFGSSDRYKKRPTGGDGGIGGNVYLVANRGTKSIQFEKQTFCGGNGQNGKSGNRHGKKGEDLHINVPIGTEIYSIQEQDPISGSTQDYTDEQVERMLKEIVEENRSIIRDRNRLLNNSLSSDSEDEDSTNEDDFFVEDIDVNENHEKTVTRDRKDKKISTNDIRKSNIKNIPQSSQDATDSGEEDITATDSDEEAMTTTDSDEEDMTTTDSDEEDMTTTDSDEEGDDEGDLCEHKDDNDIYDNEDMTTTNSDDDDDEGMTTTNSDNECITTTGSDDESYDEDYDESEKEMGASDSESKDEFDYDNFDFNKKIIRRELICDLDAHGKVFLAALGGKPGKGNTATVYKEIKSLKHHKNPGSPGEINRYELELKIISDVGLVGKPNAGKSSFLRAVTRATPKIANYKFTTLFPNLGVAMYSDHYQLSIADIPGLIEGAHQNRGLGHEFLRHIERTKVLLLVVDVGDEYTDSVQDLQDLMEELKLYKKDLSLKPLLVLANKTDLPGSEERLAKLKSSTNLPIVATSCHTFEKMENVMIHLRKLVEENERKEQK